MDKNYKDGNEILHKRVFEEKTPSPQSDDMNLDEENSAFVFRSFAQNSKSEHTSLFSSDENSLLESAEVSDADSDNAFPLFLSFKANDPISSVSEGVFEKYTNKPESDLSDKEQTGRLFSQDENPSKYEGLPYSEELSQDEPLNHPEHLSEHISEPYTPSVVPPIPMETPIFKPFESKYEESQEPSYDIPQVFAGSAADGRAFDRRAVDRSSDGPYSPVRNQSYENEIHSVESYEVEDHNPVSRGKSPRPIVPDTSTARPGARYTAAQQMGNIVPLSDRERNTKRHKTRGARPMMFILLSVLAVIAAVAILNAIDPNHPVTDILGLSADATLAGEITAPSESESESESAAVVTDKPSETAVTTVETTTTETTKETTAAAATEETTKQTTAAATAETTKETTAATTAAVTVGTTAPSAGDAPAMTPSGFSTYISGGKSDGDTASFNIVFKNQGNSDVSFYDGIEYITVTFVTNSIKITDVTSDEFTFSADPDKSNTFIGTPADKEVIAVTDSKTVAVSAKSDGVSIGKYSIKYYVKGYT